MHKCSDFWFLRTNTYPYEFRAIALFFYSLISVSIRNQRSAGRMDPSLASSSSSSSSNTVFVDLNDDCLAEVFKHLDLIDLCATSDVARRFRQNSQKHFASPKFKNAVLHVECSNAFSYLLSQNNTLRICLTNDSDSPKNNFRHTLQFLRSFGMLVESVVIRKHGVSGNYKYKMRIFDLISLYCGGTLIELYLFVCDLVGENEITLRPLLLSLQFLSVFECEYSISFGRRLSNWAPELRTLHLFRNPGPHVHKRFDIILRQPFPKLEWISFQQKSNDFTFTDHFEEFVKMNPQLKHVHAGRYDLRRLRWHRAYSAFTWLQRSPEGQSQAMISRPSSEECFTFERHMRERREIDSHRELEAPFSSSW